MRQTTVNGRNIWISDAWEIKADASQYGGHRVQGDEIAFRYCPVCNGTGRDNEYSFHVNVETGAYQCHRATCGARGDYASLMGRVPERAGNTVQDNGPVNRTGPAKVEPLPEQSPEEDDRSVILELAKNAGVSVRRAADDITDSGWFSGVMETARTAEDPEPWRYWAKCKYRGHWADGTRFLFQTGVNTTPVPLDYAGFVEYCENNPVPNFCTKNAARADVEKPARRNDDLSPEHMLLEVDDAEQWRFMELLHRWRFPVTTVTFSGNRSIHAVMPLPPEACEGKQYKTEQKHIAKLFEKFGVNIDVSCFDVARLTRVGGAVRTLDDGAESEQYDLSPSFADFPETWDEWFFTDGAKAYKSDMYKPAEERSRTKPLRVTFPVIGPDHLKWLIPESSVFNMGAEGKTGKSFFALDIAAHIATGKTWAGVFETTPGRVLYLDFEMDEAEQFRRMNLLHINPEEIRDNMELITMDDIRGARKTDPVSVGEIVRQYVNGFRPNVIIMDSIARYFSINDGENENSNTEVNKFFEDNVRPFVSRDCSVMLIRHTGKATDQTGNRVSAKYGRGASAFEDAMDTGIIWSKGSVHKNPETGETFEFFDANDVRFRKSRIDETPFTSGKLARITDADGFIRHEWMTPEAIKSIAKDKLTAEVETWRGAVAELVRRLSSGELESMRRSKKTGVSTIARKLNELGIDNPFSDKTGDALKKAVSRAPESVRRNILVSFGILDDTDDDGDDGDVENVEE